MKSKHAKAYMECAEAFARCSVGERLKVGAVIVKNNRIISCGYNALPEHLDGPLEDENGTTKPQVRHAEKNALLGLVRSNESSVGATLFCTHACCEFCAIDVVDAGITAVYYQSDYRSREGLQYLIRHGVIVSKMEDVNYDC